MDMTFVPIRNATSAVLDADQKRLHSACRAILAALPKNATPVTAGMLIATIVAQGHDRQAVQWAFWSLVNSNHLDLDFYFEVRRTSRKLPSHLVLS